MDAAMDRDHGRLARVVVGVDGSPGARVALRAALVAAVRRRARLDVVTVVPIPSAWLVWTRAAPIELPDALEIRADIETRVRALVDEAVREMSGVPGVADLDIGTVVVEGAVVPALLDEADGAGLLVVGGRDQTSTPTALIGSVALHSVSHAPCPVLIARRPPDGGPGTARIVVGVDGSAGSRAAVAAAVEEAMRGGAEVEAVAVFSMSADWTDMASGLLSVEQVREELVQRTEDIVAQVLAGCPDTDRLPTIRTRVIDGRADAVLDEEARDAHLLVIGSHGHATLPGLLLGSTALHCAMHSQASVLVVRPSGSAARRVPRELRPAAAQQ